MAETQNSKFMVNFTLKKVISVNFHIGSQEYQALLKKGYVKVATIKPNGSTYVEPSYFDFGDKYDGIDTIQT